MKNIKKLFKKAAELVLKEDRPLYLFGDGDLDGVVSVIVAEEALEKVGKEPDMVLFAGREKYGYGLSDHFADILSKEKPGLLIVFDCGKGNKKQLEMLDDKGFTIVVIDHHPYNGLELPGLLINPKEVEEEYLREACAAGLSMIFYEALLREAGLEADRGEVLDLVLIATIADMVPEEGLNKDILLEGFEALSHSGRPALEALFSISQVQPTGLDRDKLGRALLPILTSAISRNSNHEAYHFLKDASYKEALKIGYLFLERRRLHNRLTDTIVDSVRNRFNYEDPLVFMGDEGWPLFLAARAASTLARELNKPLFLYNKGKLCQGSVRVPDGVNSLDIMRPCADLFENWGGHPPAAGFGFKHKNEAKVKKCLIDSYKDILNEF